MGSYGLKGAAALVTAAGLIFGASVGLKAEIPEDGSRVVLEDFSRYPEGWKARGDEAAAEAYELVREGEGEFLRARGGREPVRIFKKIAWDTETYPLIEWKWRVTKWPESGEARAYLYVSLDRDFIGIPTIVKYVWSRDGVEGALTEGGFFQPAQVVVRAGALEPSEWAVERIDARADFEKIVGRAPRGKAYGIGLLADPGVEFEIGGISARRPIADIESAGLGPNP